MPFRPLPEESAATVPPPSSVAPDAVSYSVFVHPYSEERCTEVLETIKAQVAGVVAATGHLWQCQPFTLHRAEGLRGELSGRCLVGDNIEVHPRAQSVIP